MPTELFCVACNKKLPDNQYPTWPAVGRLCDSCKAQGLFRKRIIITGITRMRENYICVSGLDPETWRFIRPVFSEGRLAKDFMIDGNSQTFRLFDLVEMEFTKYNPSPIYHTEDWIINRKFAPRFIRHLTNEDIISILNYIAIDNLREAFDKRNKSLFIVKTRNIYEIRHEYYDKFKVRFSFIDWSGNIFERIPVVDLLMLAKAKYMIDQHNTIWKDQIMSLFNNNPYRYLRIGTTREWKGQFWQQVSAIITIPDIFDGEAYIDYAKKGANI
jgi:hypothetical protein